MTRYIPRAFLAAALVFAVVLAAQSKPWNRAERLTAPTILIGTGCTSGDSVQVADEEDELPACAKVERHYLPESGR